MASDNDTGSERRGRVLVVDDEPLVSKAISRVLAAAHDVTVAPGGREALARLDAGERFDVVLCDLMMPGMTGMDLYAALEQHHPDVARRVVFLTGGAFTAEAQGFLDRTQAPRVGKPFDAQGLRAVVAERLAALR